MAHGVFDMIYTQGENAEAGIMKLLPVSSSSKLADVLTKLLSARPFHSNIFKLGILDLHHPPHYKKRVHYWRILRQNRRQKPPQTKVSVTTSIAASKVAFVIMTSIAASYSGFPVKVSPPLDRQLLPSSLLVSRRAAPTYRCDL
ncbi:hypothetical protein PIB30_016321 [Stylosanthes scabra]|uniref:Uncharacterized protein n=1 Tax=Stylosanthes scabra TaxID=79078 RepID=A0ABU6R7L0_9FABA|nr:hypothetical protein [Stylosanthes scabra]